ncbi:MFS transporter [Planomicrobium sp. CPCC 101110]|uniref:MFS transporter n=1 Tax=Planomicrobium sp. CPCC 101110 TaxID=2599619 RepID=UPI0011B7B361|nr:MFS transporter [Planomicrobium sp. CPCC 101110]TWT25905.1 MFS transporter [Planomicrobium sp. CPCC 101110]
MFIRVRRNGFCEFLACADPFTVIVAFGELAYPPVRNAEQADMMPADKRKSYSALTGLSFSGTELIARASIIIGAYLAPTMMSVYMGILLMAGTAFIYTGLYGKKQKDKRALVTKEA